MQSKPNNTKKNDMGVWASVVQTLQSWLNPSALSLSKGGRPMVPKPESQIDTSIIFLVGFLLLVGLVMVYSSSIGLGEMPKMHGIHPMHFLIRQLLFTVIALVAAVFAFYVPMQRWQAWSPYLFIGTIVLLGLVLLPFVGKLVNNSRRWIALGAITLQPSELMKLAAILFSASYCVKKQGVIDEFYKGSAPLFTVICLLAGLLMLEPDLGALLVIAAVTLGILFLGGSSIKPLLFMSVGSTLMTVVTIQTSKRARRVLAFLDPWSPEFIKTEGLQLTNSLIAFGRGELFGVGLGNSVEKLTHLTEAHTDFILAIIAEELGFLGVFVVIACYVILVCKAFAIGRRAEQCGKLFDSLVAQGIGLWLGLQVGIHLCVNTGALPTKGLTLPFISYGGSALLVSLLAITVLLRIDYEVRRDSKGFVLKII